MPSYENIRQRLPSLYRPEPAAATLFNLLLRSYGDACDELNAEASQVMQAHWARYADRALYAPFLVRQRIEAGLPPLDLTDDDDQALVDKFPYLHDLARLASLLGVTPWREPPEQRETVEAFRERLAKVVDLYKSGLATVDAMRGMVDLQLSVPVTATHAFAVEEYAPLAPSTVAVEMPGEPLALVGPLMRWSITNDGVTAVPPTFYIGGVTPVADQIEATVNPVIELYQTQEQRLRVGLAYLDTVAPGETLRLRPAFAAWLGTATGPQQAVSHPTADTPGDPTATGPWQAVAGAPLTGVTAMLQTVDKFLWVATEAGELWRYDGQSWQALLTGQPPLTALAADGLTLLLGTTEGLRRWHVDLGITAVVEIGDDPVHAIYQAQDGQWWVGSASGLWRQVVDEGGATFQPFVLHASLGRALPVYAIHQDALGTFYFGVDLGVFHYQPGADAWYWYAGDSTSEQTPEWQPFYPAASGDAQNLPTAERVFLPPVRAIHRGQDGALWLGTAQGLARYVAQSVGGLSYTTQLQAFPDLLGADETGRVTAMRADERGHLWFCTGRGLLRYDGHALYQWRDPAWVPLGAVEQRTDAELPGGWRFDREQAQWQQFERKRGVWTAFTGPLYTTAEAAVRTVLWVDQVVADLGTWDGTTFTPRPTNAAVDATALQVRFKPDETTIITGGIPALPRLPVGNSTWRYLRLEAADIEESKQRPAWTTEGRLLPLPADLPAPPPGRYDQTLPPPASDYDEAVFAFPPAAQLWLSWSIAPAFSVLVRLQPLSATETVEPALLDRLWQGLQQVRPAGVRLALAVGEKIVRA